jgi:hypothetical protein
MKKKQAAAAWDGSAVRDTDGAWRSTIDGREHTWVKPYTRKDGVQVAGHWRALRKAQAAPKPAAARRCAGGGHGALDWRCARPARHAGPCYSTRPTSVPPLPSRRSAYTSVGV